MTEPVAVHTPTMPRLAPWLTELRCLGTLAVPLAATQLAQMAMVTTDLVMIGRLGETPLAAAALGATLWVFGWLVGYGPAAAVAPVVAQMVGARPWDKVQARACVRMGLWAGAMLGPRRARGLCAPRRGGARRGPEGGRAPRGQGAGARLCTHGAVGGGHAGPAARA